jgi:hypothetical protein
VAGHSLNEAEKLLLRPGLLDITSKRISSVDRSVEPAFTRGTLIQATLTPIAFKTRIITYLPNIESTLRLARQKELLKRKLIL